MTPNVKGKTGTRLLCRRRRFTRSPKGINGHRQRTVLEAATTGMYVALTREQSAASL